MYSAKITLKYDSTWEQTRGIMTKKLCKDCKWYRKDWMHHIIFGNQTFDMCASPNTTDDLVTGRKQRFCDMLRSIRWKELDYACGPDGRYWEEK